MDSSSPCKDAFAYDLLLQKMQNESSVSKVSTVSDVSTTDASTAEPGTPTASSIGADVEQASQSGISSPSEDLMSVPAPAKEHITLLRNFVIHDARMAGLVRQIRSLSETVFDEDCLHDLTKKSGWKLTVLASYDLQILCGFIVAKVVNGTLSVSKLAVPVEFRGNGFGKLIMEEVMKSCKKQGNVYEVSLSSLPAAVTFYQRLGFKAFKGWSKANMERLSATKNLVDGQVYMEKKLCPRRR